MGLINKFLSFITSSKKKENTTTFKFEVLGKEYNITLNGTEQQVNEALLKMKYNAKTDIGEWTGENEIQNIREDGYVIYKSNRVTIKERNQIGFYGLKWFSENAKYCAVYLRGGEDKYNIALIDILEKKVLYQQKLPRAYQCLLTNNGIAIYNDWGKQDSLGSTLVIFDTLGNIIFRKKFKASIGDVFLLSTSQKFVLFDTLSCVTNNNDCNKIWLLNLNTFEIKKLNKGYWGYKKIFETIPKFFARY